MTDQIPGPRGLPIIGNLLDVQHEEGITTAIAHLADIYGPVFQLRAGGKRSIIIASAELLKELCDEKRFVKMPPPALQLGKGPFGLFSAKNDDPDWGQAHRILMPAFGPLPVEGMFDGMKDLANQLVLKWARQGPEKDILLTEDYTRLTLDTIALCTMDYRFNSFYQEGMHPFVQAMLHVLKQNGEKASRPWWLNKAILYTNPETDTTQSNVYMGKVAKEIIEHRRSNPVAEPDFLDTLLNGKDPKTGEKMRDALIAEEMITFLVAGHETTSGLLSFATLFLLQNPETLRKAQDEVDAVTGGANITSDHVKQFKYLEATLRETLRLCPTAPALSKSIPPSRQSEYVTLMDGRYHIEDSDRLVVLLGKCMQDPAVFGEDANQFRPERMLDDNPEWKIYQQFWRPFGNGQRSCIGRVFALQEAVLALATVLQNFDLRLSDPSYRLKIKQALTIKPDNLYVKARLRGGITATALGRKLYSSGSETRTKSSRGKTLAGTKSVEGLNILYGSNTGTCQALAQKLASEVASRFNLRASVQALDDRLGSLSNSMPTVIVSASYEGEPPDNALHFVNWLEHVAKSELQGVKYAVFGVGDSNWANTFHRIPKMLDDQISACGGKQLVPLGTTDVSKGSAMGDFEGWLDATLLPELEKHFGRSGENSGQMQEPEAEVSIGGRATILRHDVGIGTVKNVKILTADAEPEKRHIEIELPAGSEYECGDYLAILPQNPESAVRKIMTHFDLPLDATIKLTSSSFAPLPLNSPLSVSDLLRNYVELAQPATKRALQICMAHTDDQFCQKELSTLISNQATFESAVSKPRMSVFDVLKQRESIKLPFPTFLSLLLPLALRQYSISSSPLASTTTCTLTYGVIASATQKIGPDYQYDPDREFFGVASNYLASLQAGDKIQCSVRRTSNATFRLPLEPATPLLMFCAGTGLAPFRGFIQQRMTQLSANPTLSVAPAILFIGCRSKTRDCLYADEISSWAAKGAVTLKYAFSAEPEHSYGCKHVDELMQHEADLIIKTWRGGARAYVCGSRAFAESVTKATLSIVRKRLDELRAQGEQVDEKRYEEIRERIRERAASDIFD